MQLSKYKNSFFIIISLLLACKGEDGAVGPSGLNSLIQTTTEPVGSNCEFGGLKVESGIDNNSNGTLDSDEVLKTDYVCSVAGNNSLINVVDEPAGTTCSNAGIKIESGVDDNDNGTLDVEEVDITRYICNGVDGGFDEQIRLVIIDKANSGTSSSSTTGVFRGDLYNFNKTTWVGVDSIVFVASVYGDAGTGFIELYDDTNGSIINNSTLVTQSDISCCTGEVLETSNLYNDLPESSIDLKIQIRVSDGTKSVGLTGKSYLFLFRQN